MSRLPIAGLFLCALAPAQTVSFGVVGGASLTPDFNSLFSLPPVGPPGRFAEISAPERYIAGGMVEFQLPADWSIEVDEPYHPLRFDTGFLLPDGTLTGAAPYPVVTWEFPALVKYRFRWGAWRPFLEAGPAFRDAPDPNGLSPYGVTAGAGIETHLWRLALAPAVRYTHWGRYQPRFAESLVPVENQVGVLAGLSF